MPKFSSVVKLSDLNGKNGFRIDGETAGDSSGRTVAIAGDLNGDGFSDFLIGTPHADYQDLPDQGAVYLVFGSNSNSESGGLGEKVADGGAYKFRGVGMMTSVGYAISGAGDVNGDGIGDILIGAYEPVNGTVDFPGLVYVVFGGADNFRELDASDGEIDNVIGLEKIGGKYGFSLVGPEGFGSTINSVSGAGDFNGDGFSDIVIGSPFVSPVTQLQGESFIVFGGINNLNELDLIDNNDDNRINLDNLPNEYGFNFNGDPDIEHSYFGYSVSYVDDINGDGFQDVIVGAFHSEINRAGAAYVLFGNSPTGLNLEHFDTKYLDGKNGFKIVNDDIFSRNTGVSVAGAGDVNGDGLQDLIVGGSMIDHTSPYVVYGKQDWDAEIDLSALDGRNGFRIEDLNTSSCFYTGVSCAGDINGDGISDLLITSNFIDSYSVSKSIAYVIFGTSNGFSPLFDLNSLDGKNGFRIEGNARILGATPIGSSRDINGDGFDDIVLGDYYAGGDKPFAGSTYVIYGHRAETAVTRVGTATDNRINGGMGDDQVSGLDGNDTLIGWEGDDHMLGGGGKDVIDGGRDNDMLFGGGDADRLLGRSGDDQLRGDSGKDVLIGGNGDDAIFGGSGDDTLNGGSGGDMLNGGAGTDTATYACAAAGIAIALDNSRPATGDAANDTLTSIENLVGSRYADVLRGNSGDNILSGGRGRDFLTGGGGADLFDFSGDGDSPIDAVITDFTSGEDHLGLAMSTATWHLTAAGHHLVVESGDSTILLRGVTALTAGDFVG